MKKEQNNSFESQKMTALNPADGGGLNSSVSHVPVVNIEVAMFIVLKQEAALDKNAYLSEGCKKVTHFSWEALMDESRRVVGGRRFPLVVGG